MIVAHVTVRTRENAETEFERVMREIQAEIRTLTGCVKNEWYRDPDLPQRYIFYGEFDTHENFQRYLKSSAVQRIGAEIMPLLAAPPEFKHYTAEVLEGS